MEVDVLLIDAYESLCGYVLYVRFTVLLVKVYCCLSPCASQANLTDLVLLSMLYMLLLIIIEASTVYLAGRTTYYIPLMVFLASYSP